jgi:ATP-dependent RNA helicase DeaD
VSGGTDKISIGVIQWQSEFANFEHTGSGLYPVIPFQSTGLTPGRIWQTACNTTNPLEGAPPLLAAASPVDTPSFSELGLAPQLLSAVEALGFERPSPIQALTIPAALEGGDLVGLSETGSGKTAAFLLPALQKIDAEVARPQLVVVCPSRELAMQVCSDAHQLGATLQGLRIIPVYGGAPIDRQFRQLREGAHGIVGTPGRLLDHLRRGSLKLDSVKVVVLDEADRMLDMGFRDDMSDLLKDMPKSRQMLFFSATMNREVEKLIQRFGKEPETITIEQKSRTVSTIEQCYYEVRQRSKVEVLSRLLDIEPPGRSIVFCNTKRAVDEVTEALLGRGYAADRLHGDITQQMRERVLSRFREGTIELLIATDVAARGLDIDDVAVVFNYDLPQDPEDYLHRVGRTGRAGRSGRAVSFVFGRDIYRLQSVERYTRQQIRRASIPSQEQVEGKRGDLLFQTVRGRLEQGTYKSQQAYVDRLLDQGHTPTDIASVLFNLLREAQGREGESIVEDRDPGTERKRREREPRFDRSSGKKKFRDDDRQKLDRNKDGRRENRFGDRPDRNRDDRRPDRHGSDRSERPIDRDRGQDRGGQDRGDMVSLVLNLGRESGVKAGQIAGMIYSESGLPQGSVGQILLFPKHTVIDVPERLANQVISGTRSAKLCGKRVTLDLKN